MKKQRIRISIGLLIASTLAFLGITYYLISNTYKLEKNTFHYTSTKLVSEIFFSSHISFDKFDEYQADYKELLVMKEQNTVDEKKFNKLKSKVQKAFHNLSNIEDKINTAFVSEGIDTKVKTAYSISKIQIQTEFSQDSTLLETSLKKNELLVFGKESNMTKSNFYTFHHSNDRSYYQSILYIKYPKLLTFLLSQMQELLFGIFLVNIIIFGVFIYIIQTIRRQKKLADVKNDFINNMTHELNTPISTITVAGQNLMKDGINQNPELVKELASTIIRQNKRLYKTVSQVMDTSLIDASSPKLNLEKHSLHILLNEIIADFKISNPTDNFKIATNFSANTDEIAVDKFQFSSAIHNIFDNARKYSTDLLELKISTYNNDNGMELQISDNGIGISPSDLKQVFEKFYRVPQGNIHKVKGLGLGLYMVKQIIVAHNGDIEIQSNLGSGTTILIHLPQK